MLVLASSACHAAWNLAARKAAGDFVLFWLAQCTSVVTLSLLTAYVLWTNPSIWPPSPKALAFAAATGVLHAAYYRLLARAYELGEISLVYPIARGTGVALTAVLAWLLLNEQVNFVGTAGISLVLLGILILGGGPLLRGGAPTRGYIIAIGVGVSIAAYSITDKIGTNLVHPVVYMWLMQVGATMPLWYFVKHRSVEQLLSVAAQRWRFLLLVGPGAVVSYLLILFAYTIGPVSYIVAARELSVVIGVILGVVVLKEQLTVSKMIAISTIIAGLVLIRAAE
jgi:uncharacterized membrane protein